jgi:hypothetical protein
MSRLSLSNVIDCLEAEFQASKDTYLTELPLEYEEGRPLECLEVLSVEDSLVVGPPLLESSILEETSEITAEDVPLSVRQSEDTSDELTGVPQSTQQTEIISGVSDVVELELSAEDKKENILVDRFIQQTCGCKGGPKKTPCSSLFSKEILAEYRSNCLQLSNSQLD